jgi:hypothetical protein
MKRNERSRELSLEGELFLAVCRTASRPSVLRAWAEHSEGQSVDWELVLRMAAKHRVMPLLHRHVQAELCDRVPKSWFRRLESRVASNSDRCQKLARELVRIQETLCEAKIESLVFKGTVLAERVYKDVTLRQGWDIDVLVRHDDRERSIDVLRRSGYEMVRSYDQAIDFVHTENGTPLDLHWNLTPKYFPYQENIESFFDRAIETLTSAGTVKTLCDEDLVAVLCLQIAKDAWERQQRFVYFFKVVDLAEALSVLTDLDWEKLQLRAKQNGWLTILRLAVGACETWLGVEESVCNTAAGIPMNRRLQKIVHRMGENVVSSSAYNGTSQRQHQGLASSMNWRHRVRQGLFFIQIRERPVDWVRYGAAVLYHGVPEFVLGEQRNRFGGAATPKREPSDKVAP